MSTNDELPSADREYAMAIAELRARADANDDAIEKLDDRVTRHDEVIAVLRETVAKVATKDDIVALTNKIDDKYSIQMRDAQNSIPGKVGVWLTGGSLLIALVALVAGMLSHHG